MTHSATSATAAQSPRAAKPNRRAFLGGLGALGTGAVVCGRTMAANFPARYAKRFQLFAEGTVTDFSLVWPAPQLPPLAEETIIRIRLQFPFQGQDILEWLTYLAPLNAPDQSLAVVTLFHMRVDKIGLSETPARNFGLFGQVIDNPVVNNPNHSPWGDLTGEIQIVSGQFDAPGNHTVFTLLGGNAAGNHASALRTATGSLHIQGPWNSF